MVTCGIDTDGSMKDFSYGGAAYPTQGEWAVYYIQGYHDQFLFRVPLTDLARDLPIIESELSDESKSGERPSWLAGYSKVWKRLGHDEKEVRRLLGLMHISRFTYAKCIDEKYYSRLVEDEQLFRQRWQRANRFWATVLFEFAWLSLILVFATLPWIRGSGHLAWAVHLGLTLPLLLLPFYFGYVPYTFTSAFPAGGVLYPYTIFWLRGLPVTNADIWLLEHLPQLFEPLTQEPGEMLALTGMGVVGPIAICALGLFVFVSVYGLTFAWSRMARKMGRSQAPV